MKTYEKYMAGVATKQEILKQLDEDTMTWFNSDSTEELHVFTGMPLIAYHKWLDTGKIK